MTTQSRRDFLQATVAAAASAVVITSPETIAMENSTTPQAFAYRHQPKPLPFNAKALRGLSERLIVSHWENNYGGAVSALNAVRERLTAALASNDPPYFYNDLKREHLIRTGSVVLHELYFANLGGNGNPPGEIRSDISRSFGSYDAWESEFRRMGQGLGGGSGWVVLGYNRTLGMLENYWMADHTTYPANTEPVLVLDMYEHSYHMDYGAAAARYIDAFFANIDWDSVGGRLTSPAG